MTFVLALAAVAALQVPDTVVLAPVTVTATRQAANLFVVPLAITQIKKADLFGTTGYGLDDALTLVPGVVVQSRYGNQDVRIAIRGYGARGAGDRSNAGTTRGIRVVLDGFPETEPDGRTSLDGVDLAAAQHIEVVRSNSSAVWGNAAGGVVSISTLPQGDAPGFAVEPLVGAYGLQRFTTRASAALGGDGRFGASFVRSQADGWRAHSASQRSLLNAALQQSVATHTQLGVYAVASQNLFRIPGPVTAAQADSAPRQANATYLARDERRFNRVARLGLTIDHQISERLGVGALLYVNPKSLQRSERGTYRDFTRYHVGGNASVHIGTLLVGADYALQDGAILFYSLTPQGTRGDTIRDDKGEGARNAGVFITEQVSFGPGDRWTVSVGARYDDITYDYRSFINPALNARRSFTGLTPKAGVSYRLSALHSVYASVGGGIEAPAGNETDPASTFGQDTVTAINPLLDPIRSTTVEIGTRRQLTLTGPSLLRDITYDVALYQTAVRNEIIPYRGGRFYFTAGRVRRRGAELGVRIATRAGIALQAAVTWADHRYTSYVVDSVHYGRPGQFADYSGNRVVGVPSFTRAFALDIAPPALRPLQVRLGMEGTSAFFVDDANQVRVPAHHIYALTLGTADDVDLGSGVGINAFVTIHNLLDRRYIASAFLNPDVVGGVPVAFEPGLPRNVVLGISLAR